MSVPPECDEQPVREFGCYSDLQALVAWLRQCGIETVAMESTGVYWIALFELLESAGIEVILVNAQHLKHVPGRKSDVQDCQWLRQLHSYGLLSASFRFSHGLRHLPQYAIKRINRFESGEKLWLAYEFENTFNPQVLTLNIEDYYIVGYCPQYLNREIFELLQKNPSLVEVRVERVNQPPTPFQFRLLCNLTARWSEENSPFSGKEYQPLIATATIDLP